MSKKTKVIIAIVSAVILIVAGFLGFAAGNMINDMSHSSETSMNNIVDNSEKSLETSDRESPFINSDNDKRKLVVNGTVTIETGNLKRSYRELSESLSKFDARMEKLDEDTGSKEIVIRVPKEQFFGLYDSLTCIAGDIVSSKISVEDMTKEYRDNGRRLDVLETEYSELKDLMGSAKNIKEVLQIKDRMSELTYEIESLNGKNRSIDYNSDYSLLTVGLVRSETEAVVPFSEEIKGAFSSSISGIKITVLGLISIWWILAIIGRLSKI